MPQTPPFSGSQSFGSGGGGGLYNKNVYQNQTNKDEGGYAGLYYHDNHLVSGSLEALVRHLVPTVDYYPDVSY